MVQYYTFFSGPLVYGICFSPIADKDKFREMGFAGNQAKQKFISYVSCPIQIGWILKLPVHCKDRYDQISEENKNNKII